MDFFINKNATLPIIKMELINDGRNDFHRFMDMIQNGNVYFCMTDIDNGVKKIAMQPAYCEKKGDCGIADDCHEEYYLVYRWRERDTRTTGTYKGEFVIDMDDDLKIVSPCECEENVNPLHTQQSSIIVPGGRLVVPIREELFIHVLTGSIKK